MEVAGKVAFITGGGGGIGGGIAQACAEKGMKLVLTDINLDYAQEQAAIFGDNAIALQHDVTSLDSWASVRDAAFARFGQVDVLCNNAGIATAFKPLFDTPPEEFARVMAINVTGVYNGFMTFFPHMRDRGNGHIVNTSSMNGLTPFGNFSAYSASKFAVTGLSDGLRDEMAPHGIGVSILFPGLTRSRMALAEDSPAAADKERIAASMMEPVWLGRAVVRAIEQNEPYIISHPFYRPIFEQRCQKQLDAFREPAQPGFPSGISATRSDT